MAPSAGRAELRGARAHADRVGAVRPRGGAFTGAAGRRAGRFEAADSGTLFLDEIANIPLEVQEKILRVVEYGTFERVGSAESVQVDVRIIGATNADLAALASEGSFKQDLLDRLSFEVLLVPPLREREGDVLLLATRFAARMALELGRADVPQFSDEAVAALEAHAWPGNVRELKNVVERAVFRADSAVITKIEFDPFQSPFGRPSAAEKPPTRPTPAPPAEPEPVGSKPFREAMRELEARLLKGALEKARFNQKKAADILGLTYHQFRGLYRKHGDCL